MSKLHQQVFRNVRIDPFALSLSKVLRRLRQAQPERNGSEPRSHQAPQISRKT